MLVLSGSGLSPAIEIDGKTISKPYLIILPGTKQDYKFPEIRTQTSNGIYPFFGEACQFRDIGNFLCLKNILIQYLFIFQLIL